MPSNIILHLKGCLAQDLGVVCEIQGNNNSIMMIKQPANSNYRKQKYNCKTRPADEKKYPNNAMNLALNQSPSIYKVRQDGQPINPMEPYDKREYSHSNSNVSRRLLSRSSVKSEQTIEMHERLKNLHLFYKTKIQEEKAQTAQRNTVFTGIIEQMQKAHSQKVTELRKKIEEAEGEKKDVGLVDERMNQIKGSIDQILHKSSQLKESNEQLQRHINNKEHELREKEEQLVRLKQELMESRNQLQSFERLNLKENKRNKDLLSMIDKTVYSIHQE